MNEEMKTYEEWGFKAHAVGYRTPEHPIPRVAAEAISDYACREERKIASAYPWLLRPLVRWVRRATSF